MATDPGSENIVDYHNRIVLTGVIVIVTLITIVIYLWWTNVNKWGKYGVKTVTLGKSAFTDFLAACHQVLRDHGDTVGLNMGQMTLLTRDLDLLKMILVKDFNVFTDRVHALATRSNISKSIFFLDGHEWKRFRETIAPSFSSGKLKNYLSSMNKSAKKLVKVLEANAERDELVPIKHRLGQYTTELIAKLAFGVQTDCIGKEDDEFTGHAKSLLKTRSKLGLIVMVIMMTWFPNLQTFFIKVLKIDFFDGIDKAADDYFNTVLRRTIDERREYLASGKRPGHDLLQNLVAGKIKGRKTSAAAPVSSGKADGEQDNNVCQSITDEELIGHAILIIFAGLETTATTLQFCIYLMAKHPDVQEKVYEEIQKAGLSDEPTFEELIELKYLDQVVSETLRLFPPLPTVNRKALETTSYGSVTIPKGTQVLIPLALIMKDPKHYEDPEKFDPDRFSEEMKVKRDPMAYVPFGYGPRMCIGMRLALLETKVALVHMIRRVKFELNETTEPKLGQNIRIQLQHVVVVEKPIAVAVKARK